MRCGRNTVYLLLFVFFWLLGAVEYANATEPDPQKTDVYFLWKDGCPHCEREKDFLERWEGEDARVRVHYLEISREPRNYEVFAGLVRHFGIERPGVPLTVIGETFFNGYNDDSTTGVEIKSAATSWCSCWTTSSCFSSPCRPCG